MEVCPSCPNRWMADLFEALGSPEKAQEIRAAECGWVWNVWIEDEKGNPEPIRVCGRQHLRDATNKLGAEVKLASQTIQADRNEQARALEAVEAAIAEHGGGAVLQALGVLGLLTTQGGLQKRGRPEVEGRS